MRRRLPASLDAIAVPSLLMLVAWDLLVAGPTRSLAWRLVHDPRLDSLSRSAGLLFPAMQEGLDRDPVALLLAGLACLLACAYGALALAGAPTRARAALVATAAGLLVLVPTAAFVTVGLETARPFGQDGGVVQLPLALDKILAGESPYGADYSRSVLGRESRVSEFWAGLGGNPILHHHAYLPGTHWIVMPFYLLGRSLVGAFDTRLVTTLAFVLAALLAMRLVEGAPGKLTAAALVALNPLVYWHQVFGANELLFVAPLIGAVLLARAERPVAAGALLGLACATKQLAWPFAPFLLAQLSGARSLRELLRPDCLRRLRAPALVCLVVFTALVAPLALRDVRAFYGDIVAYNVGLPGRDNYPLGGTPGFGFANLVIYFGGVSSLKDFFPFTAFYGLLAPLGLLLLREQCRDGRAASALVTGSTALVASLYFSRVVHPNYLVAAAILLPLGVLASRRSADLAVIPLLLLWLAASLVERGCFRQVWEQAAAAGLPARLTGLAAALAPRAGPELTLDPLGLFYSALAAGLGVLYAAAGALGVGPRWRVGGVLAATLLLVVMPTATVMAVGQRTGLKRAQDTWVIQAPADAAHLARGESPEHDVSQAPLGREAWSESFRLEPPRFLVADQPVQPPGSSLLSVLLRPFRIDDARLLSLACMLAGMAALYRLAPAGARPLALGILLAAPLAIGSMFGSPALPALWLLLPAVLLARRRSPLLAGLLGGAACACSHEIALAVPFALLPVLREPSGIRRGLVGVALGYAVLTLPVIALDPAAWLARALAIPPIGPGVGLANILLWRGGDDLPAVPASFVLLHVTVALVWLWVLWRARRQARVFPALCWAGWFALLGLVTARTASPASLSIPLSLLALGGVLVEDDAP